MSEPVYIRKSFNAGELAPELRFRSDLETYHNACDSLKNVEVTPYGAADRRLPTRFLSKINTGLYGNPIKYIPFKFNSSEIFHIVFTDTTGLYTSDFNFAAILIFDKKGVLIQQTARAANRYTYAKKFVEQSPYRVSDINKIHYVQVKDYIFISCDGLYPIKTINRYYNPSAGRNYFKFENHEFNIEPFKDPNVDPSITVTTDVNDTGLESSRYKGLYSPTETYSAGDVVSPSIYTNIIDRAEIRATSVEYAQRVIRSSQRNDSSIIGYGYSVIKTTGLQPVFKSVGSRPPNGSTVYFKNVSIETAGGSEIVLNGAYTCNYSPTPIEQNIPSSNAFTNYTSIAKFPYLNPFAGLLGDTDTGQFQNNEWTIDEHVFKVVHSTSTSNSSGGILVPGSNNAGGGATAMQHAISRGSENYGYFDRGIMAWSYEEFDSFASNYTSNIDGNTENPLTDASSWNPGQLPSESAMTALNTSASDYDNVSGGTITASAPIFSIGCENEAFRIQKEDNGISKRLDVSSDAAGAVTYSEDFSLMGNVTLTTEGGSWDGVLSLEESTDGGATFNTLGSVVSESYTHNGSFSRAVFNPNSILRTKFVMGNSAADPGSSGLNLTSPDKVIYKVTATGPHYAYYRIVERISDTEVRATPIGFAENFTDTSRWSFGSFSERSGYPFALTIHDERLILGGTPSQPTTVFGSRINGWSDFTMGDNADDPYQFTINSDTYDQVRSLRSSSKLMVFTESSEVTMGSGKEGEAISATSIDVNTETKYGSSKVQALVTADLAFFVQGDDKRVRTTQFDFVTDKFLSSEVSLYAHHITNPGIKEIAYVRNPYSVLYFLLTDGTMASFTYEKDQNVRGWAKHFIGSNLGSVDSRSDSKIVSIGQQFAEEGDFLTAITERVDEAGTKSFYLEFLGEQDIDFDVDQYSGSYYAISDARNIFNGESATAYQIYADDISNEMGSRRGVGYFYPVYEYNGLQLDATIYNAETVDPGEVEQSDLVVPNTGGSSLSEVELSEFTNYNDETNWLKIDVNNDDGNGFSQLFKIQTRDSDGTDTVFDTIQAISTTSTKEGYLQFKVIFDHASLAAAGATRARVGVQVIMGKAGTSYPNVPVNGTMLLQGEQVSVNADLGKEVKTFVIPFDQNLDTGTTNSIDDGFADGCNSLSFGINISTDPTTATGADVYFDDFIITSRDNSTHVHNFENVSIPLYMPAGGYHAAELPHPEYPLHPQSSYSETLSVPRLARGSGWKGGSDAIVQVVMARFTEPDDTETIDFNDLEVQPGERQLRPNGNYAFSPNGSYLKIYKWEVVRVDIIDAGYGYNSVVPTLTFTSAQETYTDAEFTISLTADGSSIAGIDVTNKGKYKGQQDPSSEMGREYAPDYVQSWGYVSVQDYLQPTVAHQLSSNSEGNAITGANQQDITLSGFDDGEHLAAINRLNTGSAAIKELFDAISQDTAFSSKYWNDTSDIDDELDGTANKQYTTIPNRIDGTYSLRSVPIGPPESYNDVIKGIGNVYEYAHVRSGPIVFDTSNPTVAPQSITPATISLISSYNSSTYDYSIANYNIVDGGSGWEVGDTLTVPLPASQHGYFFLYPEDEDDDGEWEWTGSAFYTGVEPPLTLTTQPTLEVLTVSSTGEILTAQISEPGRFKYYLNPVRRASNNSPVTEGYARWGTGDGRPENEYQDYTFKKAAPAEITLTSDVYGGLNYSLATSFKISGLTIVDGGAGFSANDIIDVPLVSSKHGWFYESDDETVDTYYHSSQVSFGNMPESPLILTTQPTIKVLTVGTQGEILTAQVEQAGNFRYYSVASSSYNFGKVNIGTGNAPPDRGNEGPLGQGSGPVRFVNSLSDLAQYPATESETYSLTSTSDVVGNVYGDDSKRWSKATRDTTNGIYPLWEFSHDLPISEIYPYEYDAVTGTSPFHRAHLFSAATAFHWDAGNGMTVSAAWPDIYSYRRQGGGIGWVASWSPRGFPHFVSHPGDGADNTDGQHFLENLSIPLAFGLQNPAADTLFSVGSQYSGDYSDERPINWPWVEGPNWFYLIYANDNGTMRYGYKSVDASVTIFLRNGFGTDILQGLQNQEIFY